MITFLNCTILNGGKYFNMNFHVISYKVVIELGANELNHNFAAPIKENGNNLSPNASLDTWYYLYESQIIAKFRGCM